MKRKGDNHASQPRATYVLAHIQAIKKKNFTLTLKGQPTMPGVLPSLFSLYSESEI